MARQYRQRNVQCRVAAGLDGERVGVSERDRAGRRDFVAAADRDHAGERDCRKRAAGADADARVRHRSEEHTSELQSLMRISYAVFCWKKNKNGQTTSDPQT